jgi:hypothetical protein
MKKRETFIKFNVEYMEAKDNFAAQTWVGGADEDEF